MYRCYSSSRPRLRNYHFQRPPSPPRHQRAFSVCARQLFRSDIRWTCTLRVGFCWRSNVRRGGCWEQVGTEFVECGDWWGVVVWIPNACKRDQTTEIRTPGVRDLLLCPTDSASNRTTYHNPKDQTRHIPTRFYQRPLHWLTTDHFLRRKAFRREETS